MSEQQCRVLQLAGNVGRLLLHISVVLDPLFPPHGFGDRRIATSRGEQPFALDKHHIANVAGVLERGPKLRRDATSKHLGRGAQ